MHFCVFAKPSAPVNLNIIVGSQQAFPLLLALHRCKTVLRKLRDGWIAGLMYLNHSPLWVKCAYSVQNRQWGGVVPLPSLTCLTSGLTALTNEYLEVKAPTDSREAFILCLQSHRGDFHWPHFLAITSCFRAAVLSIGFLCIPHTSHTMGLKVPMQRIQEQMPKKNALTK